MQDKLLWIAQLHPCHHPPCQHIPWLYQLMVRIVKLSTLMVYINTQESMVRITATLPTCTSQYSYNYCLQNATLTFSEDIFPALIFNYLPFTCTICVKGACLVELYMLHHVQRVFQINKFGANTQSCFVQVKWWIPSNICFKIVNYNTVIVLFWF